jgi:hypothetical protein
MTAWTTRLPSALGSIATVALLYYVGARMLGRSAGLAAAGLLAVSPWHLAVSRLAMSGGASFAPLAVVGTLAAILWANLPPDDGKRAVRPSRAVLAGAVAAFACYGYWSLRIFLPVFILAIVAMAWRGWWGLVKSRQGKFAAAAFVLAGALVITPLIVAHMTTPAMNARAGAVTAWMGSLSATAKAWSILCRYVAHFSPAFLFTEGDIWPLHAMTDGGVLYWYVLPLLLAGLAVLLMRAGQSPAARVLLVWLAIYPVADLLGEHPTPHLLRSSPGIAAFCLIAGLGATAVCRWLAQKRRVLGVVAAGVLVAVAALCAGRYDYKLLVEYPRETLVYLNSYSDFLQAARWLKDRLDQADAVMVTSDNDNPAFHPFVYMLVGTQYDPLRWLSDRHESYNLATGESYISSIRPQFCYRDAQISFGKFHFLYLGARDRILEKVCSYARPDRTFIVLRPYESDANYSPVLKYYTPQGMRTLLVYEGMQ